MVMVSNIADSDTNRSGRNRNGWGWYDTDSQITIFMATRSDLVGIGRFESVMHGISRYIQVNSELIRFFFLDYVFFGIFQFQ